MAVRLDIVILMKDKPFFKSEKMRFLRVLMKNLNTAASEFSFYLQLAK